MNTRILVLLICATLAGRLQAEWIISEGATDQAAGQTWEDVEPRLDRRKQLGVALVLPASGGTPAMIKELKRVVQSSKPAARELIAAPFSPYA